VIPDVDVPVGSVFARANWIRGDCLRIAPFGKDCG
jgi:hypothetical protein